MLLTWIFFVLVFARRLRFVGNKRHSFCGNVDQFLFSSLWFSFHQEADCLITQKGSRFLSSWQPLSRVFSSQPLVLVVEEHLRAQESVVEGQVLFWDALQETLFHENRDRFVSLRQVAVEDMSC